MNPRKGWDAYFMDIARQVAARATCDRKSVGTVLVRDRTILSTGYNGSVRGLPHCDDVGHDLINDSCARVVHSEANAVALAARQGARLEGATAYVTASPCWPCFKLLANAGIARIVFGERFYRDVEKIRDAAAEAKIELVDLTSCADTPSAVRCILRRESGQAWCGNSNPMLMYVSLEAAERKDAWPAPCHACRSAVARHEGETT